MKNLSTWARQNRFTAISIIIISQTLLFALATTFGIFAYIEGVQLPQWTQTVAIVVVVIAGCLYPVKGRHKGFLRHSYRKQKTADLALVLSSFLLITTMVHDLSFEPLTDTCAIEQNTEVKTMLVVLKIKPEVKLNESPGTTNTGFKKTIKQWKKAFKTELKAMKKRAPGQGNKTVMLIIKILLSLLGIALVLTLAYIIAGLSCTLSCSGYPAMAVIVLLLGLGGAIYLGFIMGKAIWTKLGKGKANQTS